MEISEPAPTANPPPVSAEERTPSIAGVNNTNTNTNNGASITTPPPSGENAPAAREPVHQSSSIPVPVSSGEVAAGSTTEDAARGDGAAAAATTVLAAAPPGAATPGKKAGEGGSQPQPRSAKRSRDAPLPVGLPKSMVKRIMKLGEETRHISNEALVIVVKASELFLERFAAQAFDHAEKLGRKTIKYRDVSDVRLQDPNLLFLEAVVPP